MDKTLYIAHEKITSSEERADGLMSVTLESGEGDQVITRTITLTQKLFPYLVTETISDLTALRAASSEPIVRDILKILLDYSPKINDLKYIMEQVMQSFNTSMSIADDKKWGIEYEERRIHDYHAVLTQGTNIPSGK